MHRGVAERTRRRTARTGCPFPRRRCGFRSIGAVGRSVPGPAGSAPRLLSAARSSPRGALAAEPHLSAAHAPFDPACSAHVPPACLRPRPRSQALPVVWAPGFCKYLLPSVLCVRPQWCLLKETTAAESPGIFSAFWKVQGFWDVGGGTLSQGGSALGVCGLFTGSRQPRPPGPWEDEVRPGCEPRVRGAVPGGSQAPGREMTLAGLREKSPCDLSCELDKSPFSEPQFPLLHRQGAEVTL